MKITYIAPWPEPIRTNVDLKNITIKFEESLGEFQEMTLADCIESMMKRIRELESRVK